MFRSLLACTGFAIVVLAAFGCHPKAPPGYGPIRILAAFNLTGDDAALDTEAFNGARIALRQINDAGGVNGRNLELVPIDTASNAKIATEAVERALDDESDIVAGIGYCDSDYAGEVGALFQKAHLPFVSPGATDPKVPQRIGDDVFLAAYGDDAQARAMAQYAKTRLGVSRVAVFMDDSRDYTTTVATYFAEGFQALGGVAQMHTGAPDGDDFSTFVASVKQARPPFDAIYGATRPAQAAAFIGQVRAASIDVPLLSGDGWDEQLVVETTKKEEKSYIYITTHRFLGVDTSAMRAFVQAYQSVHGKPPSNAFAALGFDSVGLLVDAMKRARSSDPDEVRASLARTTDYPGIVGPISYRNGSRVPIKPVAVIEIHDGAAAEVWSVTP